MIHPKEAQTAADVGGHYDELDETYRAIWGEHVHHGFWRTGGESDLEATEALVELVADRLDSRPGLEAVDIGCGYGASAEYLAEHYRLKVTGFTISAAQARIAQARKPASGAFSCLHRDFAEAHRVLRPGGRLVVCAWLSCPEPNRMEVRHLLEPICREGRLPSMGSRSDYEALAADAGFFPLGYDDISRQVRRTWSICAGRVVRRIATDRDFRRFVVSRGTRNRSFLLSVPRLMVALKTGSMRYGIFAWEKAA
jgi:tocopherol O-methyltransferase